MTDKNYGAIVVPLLDWYAEFARDLPWRHTRDPYSIWLSEIMLQQTRVETVKDYYRRFLAALPDIASLANAEEQKLLKLWEGLGYYSRVRNMAVSARKIVECHGGVFPSKFDAIRALPGIGDYTAGAISSIAFGEPVPAVDGNVLRVITRITGDYGNIDTPEVKRRVAEALREVCPIGMCGEFTQSLMELGACVCLPNGEPKCGECPVAALCAALRDGLIADLPVRAPKRGRKIEVKTVFVITCGDFVAIERRKSSGLLAGMWQYPDALGRLDDAGVTASFGNAGAALRIVSKLEAKHIFTHIEWHMTGYRIETDSTFGDYTWIRAEQLRQDYPLPAAYRLFDKLAL